MTSRSFWQNTRILNYSYSTAKTLTSISSISSRTPPSPIFAYPLPAVKIGNGQRRRPKNGKQRCPAPSHNCRESRDYHGRNRRLRDIMLMRQMEGAGKMKRQPRIFSKPWRVVRQLILLPNALPRRKTSTMNCPFNCLRKQHSIPAGLGGYACQQNLPL